MSLPWVKVQISIVDNDTFKALSPGSKLTFFTALCLAQKQDAGGALTVRGIGPMTVEQIASYTGMKPKLQQEALEELCGAPQLMRKDLTGCYAVERFEEKAGEESTAIAHRDRQRRYRERKRDARDASPVTHGGRTNSDEKRDEIEDIDKELDTAAAAKNNSQPASAAERVREEISAVESPALAFCRRFLARGIELEAIPGHELLLATRWALNNVKAAEVLLESYDVAQIEAKMELFLAAKAASKIRRPATIKALADSWDFAELRTQSRSARPESAYLRSVKGGAA